MSSPTLNQLMKLKDVNPSEMVGILREKFSVKDESDIDRLIDHIRLILKNEREWVKSNRLQFSEKESVVHELRLIDLENILLEVMSQRIKILIC